MTHDLRSIFMPKGGTPQSRPADERQVRNSAGGFTFKTSPEERIHRFLILGSSSNFYRSGRELSLESAQVIVDWLDSAEPQSQIEMIDHIVQVSTSGRAPKQQPALFALALIIARSSSDEVKHYGYQQVNAVCRTGTTLFEFFSFLGQFQRYGMGARKAIARWYDSRGNATLAYQVTKYRQRAGFTHADLLRISKLVRSSQRPTSAGKRQEERRALLDWVVGKAADSSQLPELIRDFEEVQGIAEGEFERVAGAIRGTPLSWDMLPTWALNGPEVWEALLMEGNIPLGALVRNLGRMTSLGLMDRERPRRKVTEMLSDYELVRRSRLHPLNLLVALKTYSSGHGLRGSLSWEPNQSVLWALEDSIYMAYGNVEPTGKRLLFALDISGSMTFNEVAGVPISPMEAQVMLALVALNVEERVQIVGFDTSLIELPISRGMRLEEAIEVVYTGSFGATDCARPILSATRGRDEVDAFIISTDNETWAGGIHAHEALEQYRKKMKIDTKMVVLATSTSDFSIANPDDPGQLDIAGFDLSTPQVISEFVRGV